MLLPDLPLVVLDTETTGFLPGVNRVIEFASIRVRACTVEDTYEQLIAIPGEIPAMVQVLTRIEPRNLDGQPSMDDVRADIIDRIGADTLIVGQNVGFDIRMLRGEGIDLTDRPWIDTSMLASIVFPELASYSLGYMSAALTLDHAPVHRALGDVRATLQLLERCWERLTHLPPDMLETARTILGKSSPGYRLLADALPAHSDVTAAPSWLVPSVGAENTASSSTVSLAVPAAGVVDVVEDSLHPDTLQQVIDATAADNGIRHWIAVKNLDAAVRRLHLPEGVRVVHPPFHLPDPDAVRALLAQETYTADEATLALKLAWYSPRVQTDLPIHGDERSVWSGKIACTEASGVYAEQWKNAPSVIVLDHRQLLEILAEESGPAQGVLAEGAHIIVDDASMLEDTATRAYGQYCDFDALRAAADDDAPLTGFLDACHMWLERVRSGQDIRHLVAADLQSDAAAQLRSTLADLCSDEERTTLTLLRLRDLAKILDPDRLEGRLVWIEQRANGSQYLHAAPLRIGDTLQRLLYERYPTTLLVPAGEAQHLHAIVPAGAATHIASDVFSGHAVPVEYAEKSLTDFLGDVPPGKSIVLVGAKRIIEQAFIEHTAALEDRGVRLICQGMSGGQERMQAEFMASDQPTVWLLTPWMYETTELARGTADRLAIFSLPFDHPSHPVMGARSELFRNGFTDYALPRLRQRLWRIVRTFARQRTTEGTVTLHDSRLQSKEYGRSVLHHLSAVCAATQDETPTSDATASHQMQLL